MPIPIKDDASITDPRQAPYNLSRKDQKAMDDILDPLKKIGLVEDVPLGKPSPVSYPEFVIWREVKARVVVDLRRANTKLQLDAYPLPRQDDILQKLHGCKIFFFFRYDQILFPATHSARGLLESSLYHNPSWSRATISQYNGTSHLPSLLPVPILAP